MMPTNPSPSRPPVQAANHNGPSPLTVPAVVALASLTDLLAEVCVARLHVANDNQPLKDASE